MNSNDCLEKQPLCDEMLTKMNAWWRAANYLAAGQLYLLDNPLLREPLKREHVKHKIVGHWGTVPGQNFVYTHLNRVIKRYDLDMIYISGPGHGGNFMVANTYMEGSYSEVYPNVSQDTEGRIVKKAVYIAIGINLDGRKDVLGMWVGENESAKFWLSVLNGLKNRGVNDILIACIDGLSGFTNAIEAVFPQTEIQQCIIHQIRNTTKYVSYKDRKEFAKDIFVT